MIKDLPDDKDLEYDDETLELTLPSGDLKMSLSPSESFCVLGRSPRLLGLLHETLEFDHLVVNWTLLIL